MKMELRESEEKTMIVRKLRLEMGLSQEQLAAMSGVSVRTIQRIERGAGASAETLKCLAAALNTGFSELRKEQPMATETSPNASTFTDAERDAMEYVRDIKAFYVHAIQYAVVKLGLLALNLWTGPEFLWVIFPALGWGIGLMAHGLSVFEIVNFFGHGWEKRQIAKRLER